MFVNVVGDITASDQPETVMCRELAEAFAELWRTFGNALDTYRPELTTCAVLGRNGVPSIWASSPRPRSALTHSMQLRTFCPGSPPEAAKSGLTDRRTHQRSCAQEAAVPELHAAHAPRPKDTAVRRVARADDI
jgi:hypothetical protein